ncbi:putative glycosyl hydrolase family 79 C-terminal beta domain [Lyophyllum shimeji]|uniref:Glycosyl hydrolase family 79 C-terminal beta domain n=1 Tax=Lyophyllum shimeji TaxID=47721 RepID=A0A9P3PZG5_LYOSH|nr:putative glycosyl hydrolase family 79 C-terminal beta domain [Lyophyllum shimeji]
MSSLPFPSPPFDLERSSIKMYVQPTAAQAASSFISPFRRRLPQPPYTPASKWRAATGRTNQLHSAITFDYLGYSKQGVPMRELSTRSAAALGSMIAGAGDAVLAHTGLARITLRIIWPGYEHVEWARSIEINANGPITRAQLGATISQNFARFMEKTRSESATSSEWQLGSAGIRFEHMLRPPRPFISSARLAVFRMEVRPFAQPRVTPSWTLPPPVSTLQTTRALHSYEQQQAKVQEGMHQLRALGLSLALLHLVVPFAHGITVYYQPGQEPLTATATANGGNYTGLAAYNPNMLAPPPVPSPLNTNFSLQVQNGTPGMSIPQQGSFLGFSIEMSVANQVLGKNSTVLAVPFLNLMANIQQRAGRVMVRIGGNTQDTAVLVDSTPDGKILEKDLLATKNPTQTPPLVFTPDLLYMMRNISSLVNVRWFLGIPFNDTNSFRLGIAEQGQAILGDYLMGLQAGNEPDLYARHGHRPSTYSPNDYFGEFSNLVNAMGSDPNIKNQNLLIGPNIAFADWTPEQVWNTGFVDTFSQHLAYLAVENYPTDNCFAQFGIGSYQNPQLLFPTYLDHNAGKAIVTKFLNSSAYAQSKGKKLLMFETNTASCGGFNGISDSFGAALWGLDYSLQMAYANFSGALMHVGGQNVFYNPFTSAPTNQSTYHQWTIGPIYYSALVMAEVLGASNTTQVLDLNANNGDLHTPAYGLYENGNPVRVALFNFVNDPTGASDLNVSISAGGGGGQAQGPSQVKVKYLLASSVSQKGNFTWAGQTFGDNFSSDGRPTGTENITTVPCSPSPSPSSANASTTCNIRVPAPGFALVFLTDTAFSAAASGGAPPTTFATTVQTKVRNTATVPPEVLATSNGHTGMGRKKLGSTSPGGGVWLSGAGRGRGEVPGVGGMTSATEFRRLRIFICKTTCPGARLRILPSSGQTQAVGVAQAQELPSAAVRTWTAFVCHPAIAASTASDMANVDRKVRG